MANGHINQRKIQHKMYMIYSVIIVLVYIYYAHIRPEAGDIIKTQLPQYDVFGKYKCKIKFKGCENQILTGWSLMRFIIFVLFGYMNPHNHKNIAILSVMIETYALSMKGNSKLLLNPVVNMAGYTVGSALCHGHCMKNSRIHPELSISTIK